MYPGALGSTLHNIVSWSPELYIYTLSYTILYPEALDDAWTLHYTVMYPGALGSKLNNNASWSGALGRIIQNKGPGIR